MNIDMAALHAIETDRGIAVDELLDTIKSALLTAYRHTEGHQPDARIEIDRKSGVVQVIARETDADGNLISEWEDTPEGFGRVAATTARQVMLQAQTAAVASGTATLESSLMRCPTVLVYTASAVTYRIAKLVIKGVKHLGLANIIAGKDVMPELLQDAFTPERLADLLHRYQTDPAARDRAIADLDATNALLGPGNASGRAADAIVAELGLS